MALAQKLIELELTIQHQSTPTPPHHQHILPHTTPPSQPSLHPQTFRIPALHCPTNFSPIHYFKNTWVCVHLLYRKLKECRGVHRKFERGLHPGCLQPMQVHLGHGVPPPMLSVEPGGIYGTPKHQKPLFSAVYIVNAFSCTIQQNFIINAAHMKQLTSYIQLRTLVGNFSPPFSTLFIHLIMMHPEHSDYNFSRYYTGQPMYFTLSHTAALLSAPARSAHPP